MSNLDLQEQEQIEALKAWWKANGKWVVGVVILALFAYAATQFWKQHQANQALEASKLYSEVEKQLASGDAKRINDAVAALVERFASSAYAARAQFLAVQANLQANDTARAKVQLQWVIEHAREEGLRDVARLKLASLHLDAGEYDAALHLLEAPHPDAFTGLYADLKGDVLLAQGKTGEARAAYQSALEKLGQNYRSLVELKLQGLGANP